MNFSDEVLATLAAAEPLVHYYLTHSEIDVMVAQKSEPLLCSLDVLTTGLRLMISDDVLVLPTKQQVGMVLAEYLRLLLRHLDKRSRSHLNDCWMATVAQKMAINPLISRQFELPESAIMPTSHGYNLPFFQSAEFYFAELMKDEARAEKFFPQMDGPASAVEQQLIANLASKFNAERPNTQAGALASAIGSPQVVQRIIVGCSAELWFETMSDFSSTAKAANQTASWKRPSRRIPNYPLSHKTKSRSTIPVILDTSASMKPWLRRSVEALRGPILADLLVVQCDAALTKISERMEDILGIENVEFETIGGGGTDLQPAFDWVQQQGFSHCICITDEEFVKKPDTHGLQVKWWNPKTGETR